MYSLDEGADVGFDEGTNVSDNYGVAVHDNKFTGTINSVRIDVE